MLRYGADRCEVFCRKSVKESWSTQWFAECCWLFVRIIVIFLSVFIISPLGWNQKFFYMIKSRIIIWYYNSIQSETRMFSVWLFDCQQKWHSNPIRCSISRWAILNLLHTISWLGHHRCWHFRCNLMNRNSIIIFSARHIGASKCGGGEAITI